MNDYQRSEVEPPVQDDTLSLFDIARLLWKDRKIILLFSGIVAALTLLYLIGSKLLPARLNYLPDVYSTSAIVIISESATDSITASMGSGGESSLGSLLGLTQGSSTGEKALLILKSKSTLDEIAERFDLREHYRITKNPVARTRSAILRHLYVQLEPLSSSLTITFTDTDPALARDVVNELVQVLKRRMGEVRGTKASEDSELLKRKLEEVQAQIDRYEEEIKAFTAKHGFVDIESLATQQITVISQMRTSLIMKDIEIENYSKTVSVDDPRMVRLKSERDSLASQIERLEQGAAGGNRPSQGKLPSLAFEYEGLQRNLAIQVALYSGLRQQYEIAKIKSSGQESLIQVLEYADIPDLKSGPSRAVIGIVATFCGFMMSSVVVLIRRLARTKPAPPADAEARRDSPS